MNLRIKELLKERGIAVKDLATMIELTPPSVSNLINGKSKPSIGTFERIASALNVPVSDLFEQPAGDTITCPKCGTKFRMEK
jgi:transcriptional regulator with XRE-family HTH domain